MSTRSCPRRSASARDTPPLVRVKSNWATLATGENPAPVRLRGSNEGVWWMRFHRPKRRQSASTSTWPPCAVAWSELVRRRCRVDFCFVNNGMDTHHHKGDVAASTISPAIAFLFTRLRIGVFHRRKAQGMIGVGMAGLAPPLPPNRTGGFPASGSPVSGFSARLTISTRVLFQTKQPLRRKPSVGPPSAVGLTQSVAGSLLPFAQHRPPASPQPSVRTIQARRVALPEVAVPAAQDGIGLGHHLAQAPPVGTPGQRAQLLLQFLKALLARPFLASAKVPAQEVEAFGGRLDDARLGRRQGPPCFLAPLTQRRQRLLRFFRGPAPPDQVIRVADPFPAPLGHRVVQRIEIPVRPPWTDDRPLGRALFGRLPAFQFFQHSGFESLLPQGEDTPIHHSLPDQPEQSFVRNRVEVALEIQVPAPRAALTQ